MEQDTHIHRRRGVIATVITISILILLGLFVTRVVHYVDAIRTGGIDPSSYNFTQYASISAKLAANPVKDGVFDVATLDDPRLGSSTAPIVIVEFADFGCPYSRESSFTVRELALAYPEVVQIIYRDFPLVELHPLAQMAAEAGECAQDQGKFWEYHDKLYQNQSTLTQSRFVELAQELNMNVYQFEVCLESGRHADEVQEDLQAGIDAGVRGTPTFFINGNRVAGAVPQPVFDAIIQSILNRN